MTRLVYLYVAQYRNNDTGVAFPSQETIARDMGVSESSVKRGINELVKLGLLDKWRDPGTRHNTYLFRYDGVENDRAVEQEFDYPVGPQPAQVGMSHPEIPTSSRSLLIHRGNVEADVLTSADQRMGMIVVKPTKPVAEKRSVTELTVAQSIARLAALDYGGYGGTDQALAAWSDCYAVNNGFQPRIGNWGATKSHAKRLWEFCEGDLHKVVEWVRAAFECASQKEICFKDGVSGVTISSLLNDYNTIKINAWLARPIQSVDVAEDVEAPMAYVRSK